LVKFTFSIYNQQLFFTFAIPYSPYTNDDDNNRSKLPILNENFKFFNGIHVEKMGINLDWNARIDDTMDLIDSIIMIACMSSFSKPFLDF